jgi:proteic killer suppression protein
MPKKV